MAVTLLHASAACTALTVPALAIALQASPAPTLAPADTIEIAERLLDFPAPGEFLAGGVPAAAPSIMERVAPFRIMKHQVGLADYGRCVAAGDCKEPDARPMDEDVPVTGVNWLDAEAYARWYSQATGRSWRLPTAVEAAAAAGERFGGEAFAAAADDPGNPAIRWIRRYREEAAAKRPADPEPKRRGHYRPNTLGIEDFGGNVWEWTSTCYSRVTLDAAGAIEGTVENCGVRVLEGRHRAYMSGFVRDGKSGGCAMGTPPENLGFRLVLEDEPSSLIAGLATRLKAAMAPMGFRTVPRKDS